MKHFLFFQTFGTKSIYIWRNELLLCLQAHFLTIIFLHCLFDNVDSEGEILEGFLSSAVLHMLPCVSG